MNRLATGIAIASVAQVGGGPMSEAVAEPPGVTGASAQVRSRSPQPAAIGPRSERVLSLILTLEALRTAPALPEPAPLTHWALT